MGGNKAGTAKVQASDDVGRPTASSHPLTAMQVGMLAESVVSDRPWTNLQQVVCHLGHAVDLEQLRSAWRAVPTLHPTLRSRFRWSGLAEPVQEYVPGAEIPWVDLDLTSDRAGGAALARFLDEDRNRGVDVTCAPAQRLTMLRTADGPVLVWTFHHALLDGRGFTAVLETVCELHDAGVEGRRPRLPTGAPSFADHVTAVRELDHQPGVAWFSDRLSGIHAATELPITITGADGPGRHRDVTTELDAPTVAALEAVASTTGVTAATTVLAAWAVVLGRYARTDDVVFGATRSGRHVVANSDHIAGCCITTLPVRADVHRERTVADLLRELRADQVAVRPHEQTPLADIQAGLATSGPLLSTNVVFERYLMADRLRATSHHWADSDFEVIEEGGFPISLAAYQRDTLRLVLEFDPQVVDPALAQAMVRHTAEVLRNLAAADPDTSLGHLALVDDTERRRLIDLGRPELPARPVGPTWLAAFDAQAADRPHAIAVHTGEDTLTYAALDRRATELAGRLLDAGVGPRDRVVLCLPRSVEFVTAVIATHRVGAAFVPVDPTYPASSIEHMVFDCDAAAVMTRQELRGRLPDHRGATVAVDEPTSTTTSATTTSTAGPDVRADRDDPAYLIYTSGSTGRPKGVVVPHRALAAHNAAFIDATGLGPDDVALQFASLGFDVAVEEITATLAAGGRLSLRSDEMAQSMRVFLGEVERRGVTVLNLPAAFWHELVRHLDEADVTLPDCVRLVIVGGEKVSATALQAWRRRTPNVTWLNGYGPTEATITTTLHDPDQADPTALTDEVPIGRPTGHTVAYVVDRTGHVAPVGVPGELWLGGDAVASGYWRRPELTADRFVVDPVDDTRTVYRTGDLARWLPDGTLEFLGRIDRQIKLRGFRIEPGEIEAAAEQHPTVAQARAGVVDTAGRQDLALWVCPGPGGVDESRLHRTLGETLPSHMVPDIVAPVDRMPVTAGGKVDDVELARLACPLAMRPRAATAVVATEPRDDLDRALTEIFATVLGQDHVDGDTSFFDAGGHSLLALRLIDLVERRLDHTVTLPTLHEHPTPHGLADRLRTGLSGETQFTHLYPIQPHGTRPPIFGVHVLGLNGAFYRPLAEALGDDQPVYGLGAINSAGPLDAPTEVGAIAASYADEIVRICGDGPVVLAAVSLGSVVTFEVAHTLRARGTEVALVALFDASGPDGIVGVDRMTALRTHARLVRRHGWAHIGSALRRRTEPLREQVQLRRLARAKAAGRPVPAHWRFLEFSLANQQAQDVHVQRPYGGPVALFAATDECFYDPTWRRDGMGWRPHLSGPFTTTEVPGSHLSMLAPPHVGHLAAELDAMLPTLRPNK